MAKTTEKIYTLLNQKSTQLRVIEGMTPREAFDVVIFRTKIQDKVKKIEIILND